MKYVLLILSCFCINFIFAQEKFEITGFVLDDKGNALKQINIINQTHDYGGSSNNAGEFRLPVYLSDTILFSSISHQNVSVLITDSILRLNELKIEMSREINLLEDINLYSGFSMLDTNRTFGEIDLGLPFKTLPRIDRNFTPGEKRLYTVTNTGLIGSVINIFNRKHIKDAEAVIALEREIAHTEKIRLTYDDDFFEVINIPKDRIYIFLEIYAEEAHRRHLLKKDMIFELASFLEEKSKEFLELEVRTDSNSVLRDTVK